MPYRYEYIKSVPKTLIGKVNYRKLEEECTKNIVRWNKMEKEKHIHGFRIFKGVLGAIFTILLRPTYKIKK